MVQVFRINPNLTEVTNFKKGSRLLVGMIWFKTRRYWRIPPSSSRPSSGKVPGGKTNRYGQQLLLSQHPGRADPDVCFLTRFSKSPHDKHYKALKHYVMWSMTRATQRSSWHSLQMEQDDLCFPLFPIFEHDRLIGFLDASHATDLKSRMSVAGYLLILCGIAIVWRSSVQPVIATRMTIFVIVVTKTS